MKVFIKEMINRINKHDVKSYAAQSAYYLLLSLFPFIILLLIVLTSIGANNMQSLEKLISNLPETVNSTIKYYITYSSNLSATFISPILITSILMSSNAMLSLIKAFNKADDLEESRGFIKIRIIAIFSLFLIIFLIIIDLTFVAVSSRLINSILDKLNISNISPAIYDVYKFVISKFVIITFIGMLYYVLPNKKRTIKGIFPGVFFSAFSIGITSYVFIYIVNNFTKYSVVYGSLSSIIVLLIWLYICAYVLILGEEINSILESRKAVTA